MDNTAMAVIADIHGNSGALDAVLADIVRRRVERIINLGDSVYGPLQPGVTAERLMQPGIISISGNMDRLLVQPDSAIQANPSFRFVLDSLTAEQLSWLAGLPKTTQLGEVYGCHG